MGLKDKKIMQAVSAFCESQEIKDVDNFMYLCFKQGFDIKRYGLLGKTLNDGEKDLKTSGEREKRVEIEVIVEKRVEVPVEVIKEIEKIVEVPVEVIKEVEKIVEVEKVVTKVEYICDKESENELGGKIAELEENIFQLNKELESERKIFSIKTEEMENNFQNEMSKKDKELDELRQSLDIKLDDTNQKMLQETLQKLRKELLEKNQKIKDLEKINDDLQNTKNPVKGFFMKGSNINDTL